MTSQHPLESLPTAAVAQWAAQLEAPPPLRDRIRTYLTRTGREIPLRFRLSSLGSAKTIALGELQACNIPARDLFGDEGVAASLSELMECGAVTTMDDLWKLGVEAADLLGPFSSTARHARLSMTCLRATFKDEAVRVIKNVFHLTNPAALVAKYGLHLSPSDFDALVLRFNGSVMRKEDVLSAVRELLKTKRVFRAFPATEWNRVAGLDDDYLALLLKTRDRKEIAALRQSIWGGEDNEKK